MSIGIIIAGILGLGVGAGAITLVARELVLRLEQRRRGEVESFRLGVARGRLDRDALAPEFVALASTIDRRLAEAHWQGQMEVAGKTADRLGSMLKDAAERAAQARAEEDQRRGEVKARFEPGGQLRLVRAAA